MGLPQEINPVNSELMDTLVEASKMDWRPYIEGDDRAFVKILYTGSESGSWAVLFRWLKGFTSDPHTHLASYHTYILSGQIEVRDGLLNAGDYVYEPNGMLHDKTTAVEDTEYLFISNGPVLFFDDKNFTGFIGWEEWHRMK